ncbi:MAG: flhA [Thermoleophilia bacterium]|nr:flhA [Thermoleophilia bacterium]
MHDDDEFLIDADSGARSLVPALSDRLLPSDLRGDARHVEPVRIEIDAHVDAIRETVEELRAQLLDRYGFAPREIDVTEREGGWRLLVDGEVVDRSNVVGRDARGDLSAALSRNVWRMLTTDDVADLVAFARLQAPVTIDRAMPHRLTIEVLRGVLRRLLRESVPIKPLDRLIEIMSTSPEHARSVDALVARVRLARRRSIVDACRQGDGSLRVVRVAPEALEAIERLSIPWGDGAEHRAAVRTKLRADIDGARREHRLVPVVIGCPQEHRASIAQTIAMPDVHVLGAAELVDLDVTWLEAIGTGVHVPAPTTMAQQFGDMHGAVWSNSPSHGHGVTMSGYSSEIVDVEIIE